PTSPMTFASTRRDAIGSRGSSTSLSMIGVLTSDDRTRCEPVFDREFTDALHDLLTINRILKGERVRSRRGVLREQGRIPPRGVSHLRDGLARSTGCIEQLLAKLLDNKPARR